MFVFTCVCTTGNLFHPLTNTSTILPPAHIECCAVCHNTEHCKHVQSGSENDADEEILCVYFRSFPSSHRSHFATSHNTRRHNRDTHRGEYATTTTTTTADNTTKSDETNTRRGDNLQPAIRQTAMTTQINDTNHQNQQSTDINPLHSTQHIHTPVRVLHAWVCCVCVVLCVVLCVLIR